ncbi:hypothetical protein RJT34_27371 [Clitoria ternatea]|uniref:DUF8039 domain-containing protein n=1 Tax=Clitoria ternatea TaxID=43366 RepID=A0AAN9I8H6_CLITE
MSKRRISDSSDSESEDAQTTQQKGRGATRLRNLTINLIAQRKIPIEFDETTGNAQGPNRARFKSYVALLGRSQASILKKEWKDVEVCVKEQIWQNIMLTYNVPDIDLLKRKWISFAGERWKAFKTHLTSKYIYGTLRNKSPWRKYEFLDEETWQRFVETRQDPTFLEKRKKAQEIAAKNCHPHRLSRGGYELLEERMMKEKLEEQIKASQSEPSAIVSPPSPPTRHEKWKRARQNKSGEYTTEEARMVAEKIDSLANKTSQGTFVPVGREDILTVAIGKPDHPGRVRAAAGRVGLRQYFGAPSHRGHKGLVTREELKAIMDDIKREVGQELREELRQGIRQELAYLGLSQRNVTPEPSAHEPSPPQPSHSPTRDSSKGSCGSEDLPEEEFDVPYQCKLYVEGPLRLVAFGSVYNLGPTIHHKQIEDDKVRVVVEQVQDANAPLPIPTKEVHTVGQAPNHFILWPRRLVRVVSDKEFSELNKIVPHKQPIQPEPQQPQNDDPLTRLCIVAMRIGKQPIQLQLDTQVIGKATPIPFYITQKDILELIMGNELLCISVLQLWLMYLHHLCTSRGIAHIYGFLDPLHIQDTGKESDVIQAYIQSRVCGGQNECYLAPCYQMGHWQLIILCPKQNVIVFLCSFWNKPTKEIRSLIDAAMVASKGKHSKARKKKPRWIYPHYHRQPETESVECGYYVMRYMLSIVLGEIVDSWAQILNKIDPFTQEEIDDVRKRSATYLIDVAKL